MFATIEPSAAGRSQVAVGGSTLGGGIDGAALGGFPLAGGLLVGAAVGAAVGAVVGAGVGAAVGSAVGAAGGAGGRLGGGVSVRGSASRLGTPSASGCRRGSPPARSRGASESRWCGRAGHRARAAA